MGESLRLRQGAREVLEAMAADPDRVWTTQAIRFGCNDSERSLDQVLEVLLRTGAATMESTGEKVKNGYFSRPAPGHRYRLTAEGPRRIRETLDNSRSTSGLFTSLMFESNTSARAAVQAERAKWARILSGERRKRNRLEGREPAKTAVRARMAGIPAIRRRRRNRVDDSPLFDPYEGSRLGWLYRWLQNRASRRR